MLSAPLMAMPVTLVKALKKVLAISVKMEKMVLGMASKISRRELMRCVTPSTMLDMVAVAGGPSCEVYCN